MKKYSKEEIITLMETRGCGIARLLDEGEIEGPSWFRYKEGLREAGEAELLKETERLNREYIIDSIERYALDAYSSEDSKEAIEALKVVEKTLEILEGKSRYINEGREKDEEERVGSKKVKTFRLGLREEG